MARKVTIEERTFSSGHTERQLSLRRALLSPKRTANQRYPFPVPHATRDHVIFSGFAAAVDFLLVGLAGWVALLTRGTSASQQVPLLLGYTMLFLYFAHYADLYRRQMPLLDTIVAVCKSGLGALLGVAAVFYFGGANSIGRWQLCLLAAYATVSVAGWRVARVLQYRHTRAQGAHGLNVLIVGAGKTGKEIAENLSQPGSGYRVVGFLDDHVLENPQVLGSSNDLAEVARRYFVDEIVVTIPSRRELVKQVALEARKLRLDVKVVPELYDGIAVNAPVEYLAHLPVRVLHREPIPAVGLVVKRALDLCISAVAVVCLAPLFLAIVIAIRLDSRGPALYRSDRVGKKGRIFPFYKFRSMIAEAETLKAKLDFQNERSEILFKIQHDPRVTRVGKFLRRFSLDEAPQLINVLKGDMSLVGPRPPLPSEFKQYRLDHLRRLDVVPGITGLWQITSRRDPSFDNYIALDLEYIENWSLGLDLKILLRTIPAVLKGTGV